MKHIPREVWTLAFCICLAFPAFTQWSPRSWGGGPERKLLALFDLDGDGRLDTPERAVARKHLESDPEARAAPAEKIGPRPIRTSLRQDVAESRKAAVGAEFDLYDESVLRTLYLRFQAADWFDELAGFYNTDVEVPADLVVDGKVYGGVGVGFRGNSSYRMTRGSLKKSFNISIDHEVGKQRLQGYRTLNLLNANGDPTFVREVLYSRIAREYLPAPKANFVRLVVNGEDWGLYVNVEQFNSDFVRDRYGETGGRRWKIPAGRGGAGLVYHGPEKAGYEQYYELRSRETPEAWKALIGLTRVLAETPLENLPAALEPIFDIDGALRLLALENVFIDGDGYVSRGSDLVMYEDEGGRFHLIPYDNNETFKFAHGGGPNDWTTDGDMLSPLSGTDSTNKPVLSRLLEVPELRDRYLGYVGAIAGKWLDWKVIGPFVNGYRKLIEPVVRADEKKLASTEAFLSGFAREETGEGGYFPTPSLQEFIEKRKNYLLAHPSLAQDGRQ